MWGLGRLTLVARDGDGEVPSAEAVRDFLKGGLQGLTVEAAVLDRDRAPSRSSTCSLRNNLAEPLAAYFELSMEGRIYGLETEYGCLPPASDPFLSPDFVSIKAKDCVFYREHLGIVDMHYRGRDEPPGNGGFLFNGGRVYIDMGHVEYATPECTGLFD